MTGDFREIMTENSNRSWKSDLIGIVQRELFQNFRQAYPEPRGQELKNKQISFFYKIFLYNKDYYYLMEINGKGKEIC